ncbi:hypothetical protein WL71_08965 [Burkholderia ubonensis]|uniref:HTH lysR-type domain-containing protein n=2 Tax=Burkholderia ubonensis TaxID=101571 RepID=A0A107F7K3_9BURK|nr:hypothetical protein WM29_04810 [Burkholderia ubonensis]KWD88443.1 hypothetical protein WL70_07215 [Burkholderia ubonensis]KWD88765.1 hypothetical protein WL72_34290 [Burkholderia ubonensis]KWD89524.1 hypothetical protein WL71_08965 [Burkholderia ubonensis]KWD94530.1 hypothetical protein WL73_25590 [Burkholderia ubonensis]
MQPDFITERVMERLKALEIFKAVVEHGSFTKAADATNVRVPSVSRAVQDLETLLGVQLFNRTTRKVRLTSVGHTILEHVTGVLDSYESLAQVGADSLTPCGDLRIEVPALFGMAQLGPIVHGFMREHSKVRVDARLVDNGSELLGELADLAIVVGRQVPASRIARPLAPLSVGIYATPSYLAKRGMPTSPQDLPAERCMTALANDGPAGLPVSHRATGAQAALVARSPFRSNCPGALIAAVLESEGVAVLPDHIAHGPESRGELVRILNDWETEPLPAFLLYQARRNQPLRVRKFIEHILRSLGPDSDSVQTTSDVDHRAVSLAPLRAIPSDRRALHAA